MNFSVKFQDKNVLDVKMWHRKLLIYHLGEVQSKVCDIQSGSFGGDVEKVPNRRQHQVFQNKTRSELTGKG